MFKSVTEKVVVGVLTAIALAAIYALWDAVKELRVGLGVPSNAVLVFDDPAGCPEGWSDIGEEWRGRVAVAAVKDTNDTFGFGRTGGADTHTLTIEEMPRHQHASAVHQSISDTRGFGRVAVSRTIVSLSVKVANNKNDDGSFGTDFVGGGQPHNNMPPYIALYYCKKP